MRGSGHLSEDEDVDELQRTLRSRKYRAGSERLRHLKTMGRVVDVPGLVRPGGTLPARPHTRGEHVPPTPSVEAASRIVRPSRRLTGQAIAGWTWLLFELVVVALVLWAALSLWWTNGELNRALARLQHAEGAAQALPALPATPVIDVAVLPGGHRFPHAGETPQPGEAGFIPAHLLPAINNYESPAVPTPGPEHARRIQIEALHVDSAIYQGMYDWEVLKKGVAQHIGSAAPGQKGNMVLAGHNDVYGEVFRDLDQLAAGDEIVVSSQRRAYTYVVRETVIVDPADVWVMAPTEYPSLTLISCYPYRVNTKRIVVFADLAA